MRVFTYFVEPASYTLDLVDKVHDNLSIDYAMINNTSKAKSEEVNNRIFLSLQNSFNRIRIILINYWNYK